MPYLLTDEQRQISEGARRLLVDIYCGKRLRGLLECEGAYDQVFWTACQDMGWTGATVSETYGGLGLGALELCLIALECGRVASGAPFLATSYALGEALRLWGDERLKTRYLPALAMGEIKGAIAFAEDVGGVMPDRPSVRFEDGRLSGTKRWVVGGAAADLAVVLAAEAEIPCLVLTDLRDAGVQRRACATLDNSRCVADLDFSGATAVRLTAPEALAAAAGLLHRLAVVTAFEQLGGAETCLELAREHALTRYAFGQPIGKFQAIKHKIAEMYVLNELARGAGLRAAMSLSSDEGDLPLRAASARLIATVAYEYAAAEAIQVHGALGVTWEHDLHLHYRRARANAIELGAAAVWEDLIVDALVEAA